MRLAAFPFVIEALTHALPCGVTPTLGRLDRLPKQGKVSEMSPDLDYLRGMLAGLGDAPPNAEQWAQIRERLKRVVSVPEPAKPTAPAQTWEEIAKKLRELQGPKILPYAPVPHRIGETWVTGHTFDRPFKITSTVPVATATSGYSSGFDNFAVCAGTVMR